MKHLILLALSCNIFLANAQSWAPPGATWTYGIGYAFSPAQQFCTWYYAGDTIINGHNCKQIHCDNPPYIEQGNNLITYEDSSKVYWWNDQLSQYTVLYDFTKNAGESWTTIKDSCAILIKVDSTSSITINGTIRKVQFISGVWFGSIIEGIGHRYQPTPDGWSCTNIAVDMDYYTGLRCYQDSAISFYDFGIAPSCDYIVSGLGDDHVSAFSISPNPASNYVTLNNLPPDAQSYAIYNTMGALLSKGELKAPSAQIALGEPPAGNYFLAITTNKSGAYKPFVIRRD